MINIDITLLTKDLYKKPKADDKVINEILPKLNFNLPEGYVKFMKASNGAEGAIGDNSYLILYPLDELIEVNQDYAVEEFAPELFLFGSDGGGTAFAIKKDDGLIYEVPFIGMEIELAKLIGNTFNDFLQYLYDFK